MSHSQKINDSNSISPQNRILNSAFNQDDISSRLGSLDLELVIHRLMKFLITTVVLLSALSLIGQVAKYTFNYIRPDGKDKFFVQLFDLDTENNIPSLFSAGLLCLCCILLGVIAILKYQQSDQFRTHWKWLSLIFLGLAIDEAVSIHEEFAEPLRNGLGVGGFLYFAWVIPAFFFVLGLGVAYLRFILALPRQTRHLLILSAGIYLSGTIGMELIGGAIASVGQKNLLYALVANGEEVIEFAGILLFIHTLFQYIQRHMHSIQLYFKR